MQTNIQYWNYTTGSAVTAVNKAIDNLTAKTGEAGWHLSASYTAGMPNGTVIAK